MAWTSAFAIYFIVWWITLFAVLPFGVRTQEEAGSVLPGTPESAPARMRILRTVIATTLVSLVVFAVIYVALAQDWMGLQSF